MPAINPYQSPKTAEAVPSVGPQRPQAAYRSRGRAFLGGAWRGAKFGGAWMAAIMGVLFALLWGGMLAIVLYRWLVDGVDFWQLIQAGRLPECLLGTIGAVALCTLYAAVIGALFMGLAAALSYRRPRREAHVEPSASHPAGEKSTVPPE